ncbi:hypothetical protein BURKHO8Y_450042 [Burkholderia sp. 8Y]|nr:hypothetical protein BURKHO8Y_450042 [Burkholderia sp. 8Y]
MLQKRTVKRLQSSRKSSAFRVWSRRKTGKKQRLCGLVSVTGPLRSLTTVDEPTLKREETVSRATQPLMRGTAKVPTLCDRNSL